MQASISRQTEAAHVNSILNHPEVLPWVSGGYKGPLDMTESLSRDGVVALYGEHGGQVYNCLMPSLWEAHSAFTPKGRGEYAIEVTRQTLHWMFTRTDACEIVTRCPEGNAPAKALAKIIGGQLQFTRKQGWVMNGKPVSADIYSLRVDDWMRTAPGLVEKGQWFHKRLEEEMAKQGITEPPHEDDETHDRYVGAACEMIFGGQPLKGVILYNRAAVMGGYHPIQIINADPLAIDIGTTIIVMRGDDFFIPDLKEKAA